MAYLDTTGLSTLWNKIKSVFTTKDQSIPYIVGSSSDSAGVWTGSYDGITSYKDGLTIIYVPQKAGISSGTTLNINGLGAKGCYINNSKMTTHFSANVPVLLTYITQSGVGYWKCADYTDGNTYTSAYCTTSGGTAAKSASLSNYILTPNTYTFISISNANTVKGAITLNINGRGAKSIYINGRVSSASNYTLPAGTYIVYYDGTNYHFRTDGKLPGELLTSLNQNVISGVSDFDFYDDGTNATTVSLQLKSGLDKRDGLYFDTVNLATGETGETFAAGGGISIAAATTSKAGVMSAADKTLLNTHTTKIASAEDNITDLIERVDSIDEQIVTLDDQASAAASSISSLNTRVSTLEGASGGSNIGIDADSGMPDLIGDYGNSIDYTAEADLTTMDWITWVENGLYILNAEETQEEDNTYHQSVLTFIYRSSGCIPVSIVNTNRMEISLSGTTVYFTGTDNSGWFRIKQVKAI